MSDQYKKRLVPWQKVKMEHYVQTVTHVFLYTGQPTSEFPKWILERCEIWRDGDEEYFSMWQPGPVHDHTPSRDTIGPGETIVLFDDGEVESYGQAHYEVAIGEKRPRERPIDRLYWTVESDHTGYYLPVLNTTYPQPETTT